MGWGWVWSYLHLLFLQAAAADDIEMRVCRDEGELNEDIPISQVIADHF